MPLGQIRACREGGLKQTKSKAMITGYLAGNNTGSRIDDCSDARGSVERGGNMGRDVMVAQLRLTLNRILGALRDIILAISLPRGCPKCRTSNALSGRPVQSSLKHSSGLSTSRQTRVALARPASCQRSGQQIKGQERLFGTGLSNQQKVKNDGQKGSMKFVLF